MQLRSILTFAAVLFAASFAHAQETRLKDLRIVRPYAMATVPNQPSGAAYLTIENQGKNTDKLVAASSPVAKSVEIHTMSMEGDVMRMREVADLELKPATKIEMMPGHGYHLMLLGLSQPLKAGDKFPLTLIFEKAGKAEVTVSVQDKKDAKSGGAHPRH